MTYEDEFMILNKKGIGRALDNRIDFYDIEVIRLLRK